MDHSLLMPRAGVELAKNGKEDRKESLKKGVIKASEGGGELTFFNHVFQPGSPYGFSFVFLEWFIHKI